MVFHEVSFQLPGKKIDVYLKPLVAELKNLWNNVDANDSSANETFQMRVALFCTVSDFYGLDNFSGWSSHTFFSCPSCKFDTKSKRLKFRKKNCFMDRYNKQSFDGSMEFRHSPFPMTNSNILRQIEDNLKRPHGKGTSETGPQQWNKKSILIGCIILFAVALI